MSSSRWTTALAIVLALALAFVTFAAGAQKAERGPSFLHKDWQLACDNTGTCRAAGYHADESGDSEGVSVLLTRKAGPREPVTGQVMLANYGDDALVRKLPKGSRLGMFVNGRALGTVAWKVESDSLALNPEQTQALLKALVGTGRIVWKAGGNEWELSNAGATAVLLKMDEAQGRLGTRGALVKPGARDEASVPAPLPTPIVKAAVTDDQLLKVDARQKQQLLRALRAATPNKEGCDVLSEATGDATDLSVWRLNATKLLVSGVCWTAAYNSGSGFWVVNAKEPYTPVLVTQNGTDYNSATISAAQKGRGLGDCWSHEDWTWDGTAFVQTSISESGLCRGIAPGGAWTLPNWVTTVVPAKR